MYTNPTNSTYSGRMLSSSSGARSRNLLPSEPSTSPVSPELSISSAESWLKRNFDSPRFIAVYWGDAFCHGDASWTEAEDLFNASRQSPSVILTSGVLVNETPDTISVMSTLIEDGSAGGQIHVIPTGWIISRKDLA